MTMTSHSTWNEANINSSDSNASDALQDASLCTSLTTTLIDSPGADNVFEGDDILEKGLCSAFVEHCETMPACSGNVVEGDDAFKEDLCSASVEQRKTMPACSLN